MSNTNVYHPTFWVVVEIPFDVEGEQKYLYKVFGSWAGGYIDGDSWRFNSGITKATKEDGFFYFTGSSGSVYECHESSYGATAYGSVILQSVLDKSPGVNVLDVDVDFLVLDYSGHK